MPKKKTTKNPFDLSDEDIKWLEDLGIEPTENLFDLCEQLSETILGIGARGDMSQASYGGDLSIQVLELFNLPEIGEGSVCEDCAFYHVYENEEHSDHEGECRAPLPLLAPERKNLDRIHPDPRGDACTSFKLKLERVKQAKNYCVKIAALTCLIDYARWHWGKDGETDPKTRDEIVYETKGVLE